MRPRARATCAHACSGHVRAAQACVHACVHLHADDGVDVEDKCEDRADVEQRGYGEDDRHEEVAQPLGSLEHPQRPNDTYEAEYAEERRRHRQRGGGEFREERGAKEQQGELAPAVAEVGAQAEAVDLPSRWVGREGCACEEEEEEEEEEEADDDDDDDDDCVP